MKQTNLTIRVKLADTHTIKLAVLGGWSSKEPKAVVELSKQEAQHIAAELNKFVGMME